MNKANFPRSGPAGAPHRHRATLLVVLIAPALISAWAAAHEVRPAYLDLTERIAEPGVFDVLWKVPVMGEGVPLAGEELPHEKDRPLVDAATAPPDGPVRLSDTVGHRADIGALPIHPTLPAHAKTIGAPTLERRPGSEIRRWTVDTGAHGLAGATLTIHGLSGTMVDTLLHVAPAHARPITTLLRPDRPSYTFADSQSAAGTAADTGPRAGGFLVLGIEHILTGIDHLLFILGLLLLVNGFGRLIKTVTAFTIAHSVTLSLAALGIVRFPSAPVEAVIALSIAFVAREVVLRARGGAPTLAQRQPWLVAFSFGLLHGFGFAGGLTEVGLPASEVPLALLLFSVGVEIGHFSFVSVAVALVALIKRVKFSRFALDWNWLRPVPGYGIGAAAAFWLVARLIACW